MKRFMDSLFNGYVTFKRNITILGNLTAIIFKGDANKDFSIKRIPGDKIYLSRSNGNSPISNFGHFDCNTGNFIINTLITQNGEHPTPERGGFYFNINTNTWYKCSNGTNWEEANI